MDDNLKAAYVLKFGDFRVDEVKHERDDFDEEELFGIRWSHLIF